MNANRIEPGGAAALPLYPEPLPQRAPQLLRAILIVPLMLALLALIGILVGARVALRLWIVRAALGALALAGAAALALAAGVGLSTLAVIAMVGVAIALALLLPPDVANVAIGYPPGPHFGGGQRPNLPTVGYSNDVPYLQR